MQLAFDNWSGIALHSEKAAEIRKCSAVTSIYPRVKALEVICTQTSIKTVLEHIRGRKRVLDADALVMIFGEAFVTEQGLQEDPAMKVLPAAVEKVMDIAVKADVSPRKDSPGRAEIIFIDEEIAAPIATMPVASVNKKVTTASISNSSISTLSLTVVTTMILQIHAEESIPTSIEQCSLSDLTPTLSPVMVDAPKAKLSETAQPSAESTISEQKVPDATNAPPIVPIVNTVVLQNKIVLPEINIDAVPEKLSVVTGSSSVVDTVVETKKIKLTENNVNELREKVVQTSDIVVTIVGYAIWIFIALLYSGRYSDDVTANIPWVNKANATNVVMDRFKGMEVDFESALQSRNWEVLSSATNVTIETLPTDSKEWPMYVRMSILLPVKPSQAYSLFQSDELHTTNQRIDHFFVSARTLFTARTLLPGNTIRVIRKVRIIQQTIVAFL